MRKILNPERVDNITVIRRKVCIVFDDFQEILKFFFIQTFVKSQFSDSILKEKKRKTGLFLSVLEDCFFLEGDTELVNDELEFFLFVEKFLQFLVKCINETFHGGIFCRVYSHGGECLGKEIEHFLCPLDACGFREKFTIFRRILLFRWREKI